MSVKPSKEKDLKSGNMSKRTDPEDVTHSKLSKEDKDKIPHIRIEEPDPSSKAGKLKKALNTKNNKNVDIIISD